MLRRDLDEGELNVSTGQKLIYMSDQLKSVRDVIDATTGSLVQSYDYTPYGAVARSSGSTPTDLQYAGLMYHSASGLMMSATRFYDPITGRWLNRDVIRESGGINQYAYVSANPMNAIDSLGLYDIWIHTPMTIVGQGPWGFINNPMLPFKTGGVDFLPGSQDASNAYWHAMCNGTGSAESLLQCTLEYQAYIEGNIASCTQEGLARALHAVQDSTARGHTGFQYYYGLGPLVIGTLSGDTTHAKGDAWPTAAEWDAGVKKTEEVLKEFDEKCSKPNCGGK